MDIEKARQLETKDHVEGAINALMEAVAIAICTTAQKERIPVFVEKAREAAMQRELAIQEPLLMIAGRVEHIAQVWTKSIS